MVGQANWWHTRDSNNSATGKCSPSKTVQEAGTSAVQKEAERKTNASRRSGVVDAIW